MLKMVLKHAIPILINNTIFSNVLRLESAVPLLLREVDKMADKEHIAFAFPDDGACKRFHHFFGGDNPITCVKIREGNKRIVKVKDGNH